MYVAYHDEEWGRYIPNDDQRQFEFLVLESAQAGLSWITILRKREAYRTAYLDFDATKVAQWKEEDIQRLLANPGIIRNRRKIEASIGNAQAFLAIQNKYGSFSQWLLNFFDGKPLVNHFKEQNEVPALTPLSTVISKEMKSHGFKFFGPTICYAHLQATGYINDHLIDCEFHSP